MYIKAGKAVKASTHRIVLSADDQGATAFTLVRCLAWNNVSEADRPNCYSLVDESIQSPRYVRHYNYYLRLDLEHAPLNPPVFHLDSSFIFHPDTFYAGYYALESVNYPDYYIYAKLNKRLIIKKRSRTVTVVFKNRASFQLLGFNLTGKFFSSPPRIGSGVVLCDTRDTSILIVDTYVTIQVSPKSRYTAVYRSSKKYRETAQVSRVSTIPRVSYYWATSRLQAYDAKTNVTVILTVKHCASSSHSATKYYYTAHLWVLLLSLRTMTPRGQRTRTQISKTSVDLEACK